MIEQLIVLGLQIGTYTAWDQTGDTEYMFYDFVPHKEYDMLPEGDLSFDWHAGQFYQYDDFGQRIKTIDLIIELRTL